MGDEGDSMGLVERGARSGAPAGKRARCPSSSGMKDAGRSVWHKVLMLLIIGVILLICWALGFFAFHVVGGLIHLLVVLAVISIIVHLFRGSRSTASLHGDALALQRKLP